MKFCFLTLASASLFFACGSPQIARPGFCVTTEDANDEEMFDVSGSYQNLRLSSEEDLVVAPANFRDCASGMGVQSQFETEDGLLLWLGIEISSPLGRLTQGVDDRFDGVDLNFRKVGGFVPSSSLSVRDERGPLVLLESGTQNTLVETPELTVEVGRRAGANVWSDCQSGVPLGVHFRTASDDKVAGIFESVELQIDGLDGHGHNLGTYDFDSSNCDHAYFGVTSNWAYTDASF